MYTICNEAVQVPILLHAIETRKHTVVPEFSWVGLPVGLGRVGNDLKFLFSVGWFWVMGSK